MDQITRNDQRAVIAEFIGTLFFVYCGTGAVVSSALLAGDLGNARLVAIAMAHGLGILIAVAWTANISGGHINPAVTLAMMMTNHIKVGLGIAYMLAQFAGGVVGSLLLLLCLPSVLEGAEFGDLGAHGLNPLFTPAEGLMFEIILTFFLVLVVFNTAVSAKGWGINAPIAIGLTVMLIHFVAVPFTGASVNPARSFGPALVANEWSDFWIYIVGPFVGAAIMGLLWLFWKNMGDDSLDPDPEPATVPPPPAEAPATT